MKKIGAFITLFLLLFSLAPLSLAEETETTENPELDRIENAFNCLEEKVGDCSSLSTQNIALTILATPDNIYDDCVTELEDRKTLDHWTTVQDTALAILALNHAKKDTTLSEEWLLTQEETPTELVWYIQQDSTTEVGTTTECSATYDGKSYSFEVGADKKIDSRAGTCLPLSDSDFWLRVSSFCYDKEFSIKCNQDFIATLLYKNKDDDTLYILEGTKSASAGNPIDLEVKSKCFGSGSCDYEATAWAAVALSKTGHNIDEYIPYIIATSDDEYLPEAFIYMLTNYEDYATQLIVKQELGNYWDTTGGNTEYYYTALAILALGNSAAEQITNAEDQLWSDQSLNGCWQDSVEDTAMVLWALVGRAGRSSGTTPATGDVTYCSEVNYFCIPSYDCPDTQKATSYFCSSPSETCCTEENLKSCSEYYGEECDSNENCIGNKRTATDTDNCCTGTCEEKSLQTECEANFYSCMDSCSDYQELMSSYSCDDSQICCRTKTTDDPGSEESAWWIWILAILILAVLGAIGYIYREKLKTLLFKIKNKPKKRKGRGGVPPRGPRPGMPPRPGFPPIRRATPPVAPIRRQPAHQDRAMDDTFKKLKEMSS